MKKIIALVLLFAISFLVFSQDQEKTPLSAEDSVCLKIGDRMIRQMKAQDKDLKYHIDDEFLITMVKADSLGEKKVVRLLNIGDTKKLSVTILEAKLKTSDTATYTSLVMVTAVIPLVQDVEISHCRTFSIDLAKFKLPNEIYGIVENLKIKISYDDKEVVAIVGKE